MKHGYISPVEKFEAKEKIISISKADLDYLSKFNFIIGILCGSVTTMTILLTVFTFIIKDLSS
jgi:hypothetical protein